MATLAGESFQRVRSYLRSALRVPTSSATNGHLPGRVNGTQLPTIRERGNLLHTVLLHADGQPSVLARIPRTLAEAAHEMVAPPLPAVLVGAPRNRTGDGRPVLCLALASLCTSATLASLIPAGGGHAHRSATFWSSKSSSSGVHFFTALNIVWRQERRVPSGTTPLINSAVPSRRRSCPCQATLSSMNLSRDARRTHGHQAPIWPCCK